MADAADAADRAEARKYVVAACTLAAIKFFEAEGGARRLGDAPSDWIASTWDRFTAVETPMEALRHIAQGAGLPALFNHVVMEMIPDTVAGLETLLCAQDKLLELARFILAARKLYKLPGKLTQVAKAPADLSQKVTDISDAVVRGFLPVLLRFLFLAYQLLVLYQNPFVKHLMEQTLVQDHPLSLPPPNPSTSTNGTTGDNETAASYAKPRPAPNSRRRRPRNVDPRDHLWHRDAFL